MMNSILFRNLLFVITGVLLLSLSCSQNIPDKKASNTSAKNLKVKNTVPSCCSKKPTRFSMFQKPKQTLK